ncbi:hypothetical protein [Nocardioides humi]|uniref:DUF4089 domain-containing protein n=1 Tax=Nocardioides humi TaxID=449461 RepID=A0ABN1ZYT9_9ACTN|nr:hypothetical protein [Nocardioides humi]
MTADPTVLVPQLLLAAGITPAEEEVSAMIAAFPGRQEMLDRLYAIPEARYEEPCLVFDATFPS